MRSVRRNRGSCRKPVGEGGGNRATSRGREAKGRGSAELGCASPKPALLSFPRPGHRHEGPLAEMRVLAPAWSPTTALLLLLLLSPGLCGTPDCTFSHSPISSTFPDTIRQLSDYLLQDYPVTVASNLQDDKLCGAFWRLVLAQRWMGQLKTVAGTQMEKLLEAVNTEIDFVTSCALQPLPSCLRFVQTNISHLLQDTSAQLRALKPWITRRNFSGCLELQCQPDSSTLLPSASPLGLAATALPAPQASLLFLLLLPAALALLTAAWCLGWRRRWRRRPGPGEQRTPRPGARSQPAEDAEPALGGRQPEPGACPGGAAPAPVPPARRSRPPPAPAPAPPAPLCTRPSSPATCT